MVNDNSENGDEKPKRVIGKPFVKGDSRIYSGVRTTKNKTTIPAMLKRIGKEDHTKEWSKLEAVCRKVYAEALAGEGWAIQLLYDRMEGRPRQVIEVTNEEEEIGMLEDEQLTGYFIEESRN